MPGGAIPGRLICLRAPTMRTALFCLVAVMSCAQSKRRGEATNGPAEVETAVRSSSTPKRVRFECVDARPTRLGPPSAISYDELATRLRADVTGLPAIRNSGSRRVAARGELLRRSIARGGLRDRRAGVRWWHERHRHHARPRPVERISGALRALRSLLVLSGRRRRRLRHRRGLRGGACSRQRARRIARSSSLASICEEDGLVGSRAYASRASTRGDMIALAISLDAIGYKTRDPTRSRSPTGSTAWRPSSSEKVDAGGRRGDFIAAVADEDAAAFVTIFDEAAARHGRRIDRHRAPPRSRGSSSPSEPIGPRELLAVGLPRMLVTDTADFRNPRYHCQRGVDSPESLDYAFLARVTFDRDRCRARRPAGRFRSVSRRPPCRWPDRGSP